MSNCNMCNDTGRILRPVLNLVESCNFCRIAQVEAEECEQACHKLRCEQSNPVNVKVSSIRSGNAIIPPGHTEALLVSEVKVKEKGKEGEKEGGILICFFAGWGVKLTPDTLVTRTY